MNVTDRTVTILTDRKELVSIPREGLGQVEARRKKGHRLRGAAKGLVLLGLAGAIVGHDDGHGWGVSGSLAAGVLLAPVGALVGAAVLDGGEWEPVDPGRMRLSLTPVAKGAGLSVSFGFSGRGNRQ